jgi:hypothetical protein
VVSRRKICLVLPTHRECGPTLAAVAGEAAHAAARFDVDVVLLVLDSCDPATFAGHAGVLRGRPEATGVEVVHLDEQTQRRFLQRVIETARVAKPEHVLDLMLPDRVSYGACTNRAFLIAAALGCESVHRRDSDLHYQRFGDAAVYPIDIELTFLGRPAAEVAGLAGEVGLDRSDERPVAMVAGSFIGELSVDIDDIRRADPAVYRDIVELWAAEDTSVEERRQLVDESFTGAGAEAFTGDWNRLEQVDPMRVDMCNISFHGVHERVPLPPMTDTIGSDYFLIHLVPDSTLPGVRHNRHIVNFHTPDRRTEDAFLAYHRRLAKFFLSMLYLHVIYEGLGRAGADLLDERHELRADRVAELVRGTVLLDRAANVRRLDRLEVAYRRLGGRHTKAADQLAGGRDRLLAEAAQDIEDYALLIDVWAVLIAAGRGVGTDHAWR